MVVDPLGYNSRYDDPLLVFVATWLALLAHGHVERLRAFHKINIALLVHLLVLLNLIL